MSKKKYEPKVVNGKDFIEQEKNLHKIVYLWQIN